MTDLHSDFLPASGAVVIVVCATTNVLGYNAQAFDQQLKFASDVSKRVREVDSTAGIPIVLLLVDDNASGQAYVNAAYEFPALVTITDYTTTALANAVRVLFEK
jgi:hypothetical protein